jgi:hypothetical protein
MSITAFEQNGILNVSWSNLLGYELCVVGPSGRKVVIRSKINIANNGFKIHISLFKRKYNLLNGTYHMVATSFSKPPRESTPFVITTSPVSISISIINNNILTVNIVNPESISEQVILYLIYDNNGIDTIRANLASTSNDPPTYLPQMSTYTLSTLTPTPLVSGKYNVQIWEGLVPLYTSTTSFYYSESGEWTLGDVLEVDNNASTDINMFGNDILNIKNISLKGVTGTSDQILCTKGNTIGWTDPTSFSPATKDLDFAGNNIIGTNHVVFKASSDLLLPEPQGIYASTSLLNIYNEGDIHLDTGSNGHLQLGGDANSIILMSPLVVDPTNSNNVGIDLSGKDIRVSNIELSSNTKQTITKSNTEDDTFVVTNSTNDTLVDSENAILHIGRNATNSQLGSKLVMSTDPADSINKNSNTVGIDMSNKSIQNLSELYSFKSITAKSNTNLIITSLDGGTQIDSTSNVVLGGSTPRIELESPLIVSTDSTASINSPGNTVGIDLGNKTIIHVSTINFSESDTTTISTSFNSNATLKTSAPYVNIVNPVVINIPRLVCPKMTLFSCGIYMNFRASYGQMVHFYTFPIYKSFKTTELVPSASTQYGPNIYLFPGYKVVATGSSVITYDNTSGTTYTATTTTNPATKYDVYYDNVLM